MMRERFAGIRRVLRIRNVERDIDDELAFHLERTVAELMAAGRTRQQAEAEAQRRFGNEQHYRRELRKLDRRAESARQLAAWWQDVRYALRRMGRWPGLTAAVVLTFALGIGANATMFGIIDRLLLRAPEHIAEPEAVRRILFERLFTPTGERKPNEIVSFPDYEDLTRARSLSAVAAFAGQEVTLGAGAEAHKRQGAVVTEGFFALLGVQPALGRFWTGDEDRTGEQVVVISHRMWQREYAGDRSVLGSSLDFGYGPYTIIGVAPKNFTGSELRLVDLWLPIRTTRDQLFGGQEWRTMRTWHSYRLLARLAPGVTPEAAETELTALHRQGRAEGIESGNYDAEVRAVAAPLIRERGPLASSESRVAQWLAGVSLIVLLIACANVANLLLARMIRQQREIGIRLALGISRGRLLAQTLTESLLLAALGGAGALLVAHWGGGFVRKVLLPEIAWPEAVVEGRVLALVLGLALLAGLIAGLVPSLQASRPDVLTSLRSGGRTLSAPASRVRNTLTVLQAALSVVLLVGAGLFVKSLQRVGSLDLGLDIRDVVLVNPIFERGFDDARKQMFYEQSIERLNTLPGVVRASATRGTPFWSAYSYSLHVPDLDSIPRLPGGGPYVQFVDHHYFTALGIRLAQGRSFGAADTEGAPRVAVVNETMARHLWPGQSALGKCLRIQRRDAPCAAVVGVVKDSRRDGYLEEPAMQYYVPLEQRVVPESPEALLVRLAGDPKTVLPALQRELRTVEPGLRFADIQPLQELLAPQARSWQLGATMFSVFGLLALVVAAVGLYSVLAFAVAQRTHELGIRAALGASRERLLGMVLRQGLRLVVLGTAVGLLIALAAGSRIHELLFETSPRDPLIFGAVAAVLLLVALLASGIPAWRATRVDPSVALRAE